MTDPIPTRPSDPAVNEAAERLREYVDTLREPDVLLTEQYQKVGNLIDAALATERRLTVERIRELTGPLPEYQGDVVPILEGVTRLMDALAEVGEGEA